MESKILELIPHLMRPAGGGIPAFSAGKESAALVSSALYKILFPETGAMAQLDPHQIRAYWKKTWSGLSAARVVLIGAPTDTGAGIRRGAAYGPRGVRRELYSNPDFQKLLQSGQVIDLGDVYVNPHLLHDSMLSEEQKHRCREEMYPEAEPSFRSALPVSVLSQLKVLLKALLREFPEIRIQIIGGDHSVAWPVSEVLAKRYPKTLGIVQPDAHTDLLSSRLGVKYCFGTWSYHANELLGREGKLVQIGIRQSGRDKHHWESTLGVKQYWAEEINSQDEGEVVTDIVQHLKGKGIEHLYFSNDIDGTDELEAPATGTPAPAGVSSQFILKLIAALGKNFEIVGSDVVEVAPDLGPNEEASVKTCKLAAQYLMACLRAGV
jgi:arginase family enzyme